MFESQARSDINNRPLYFGVGPKDQPDHVVAGSFRSSIEENLRSIVLSGGAHDQWKRERVVFLTYSQTLNGHKPEVTLANCGGK